MKKVIGIGIGIEWEEREDPTQSRKDCGIETTCSECIPHLSTTGIWYTDTCFLNTIPNGDWCPVLGLSHISRLATIYLESLAEIALSLKKKKEEAFHF